MRSMNCATLVLTALVLVLPAARAQTVSLPASFTAFSVQSLNDYGYSEPGTLVLLSDTAGETVFALPRLDTLLDVASGGMAINAEYLELLGFVARAGYAITGLTFSGMDGSLHDWKTPSYAALAVSDARLTVSWAPLPVPEPHVWMMLVAGLVPVAAWRRKSSRQHGRRRRACRIAAAMLIFSAPALHAQEAPALQFDQFSLDYLNVRSDLGTPGVGDFSLLATTPGVTTFSLDGLNNATYLVSTEDGAISFENMLSFGLTAESGFRITRVEFTGTAHGITEMEQPPAGAVIINDFADVRNGLRAGAEAWPYASAMPLALYPWYMIFNAGDSTGNPFTVPVEPEPALQQQLQLALYAQVQVSIEAYRWCTDYPTCSVVNTSPARAGIWLEDARLTIYTEAMPVPEPQAWLMLVCGLFPLALLASRQRRTRVPRR